MAPLVLPWNIAASYKAGQLIGRYRALRVFRIGFLLRLAMALIYIAFYIITRDVYVPLVTKRPSFTTSTVYWVCFYIVTATQQIFTEIMFVAQMAFFAQISDISIGGSSMTFFNTMANLGSKVSTFRYHHPFLVARSSGISNIRDFHCSLWHGRIRVPKFHLFSLRRGLVQITG